MGNWARLRVNMVANLDRADFIEIAKDKDTQKPLDQGDAATVLVWLDGRPMMAVGKFATGILAQVGYYAH
jgi:hypothetical protein